MGQSVSGNSQILKRADVNPSVVANPYLLFSILKRGICQCSLIPHCPRRKFRQIGDREGVCKAKLQTVPAILPKLVFLMHRIKNNEIVLDYCDGRV